MIIDFLKTYKLLKNKLISELIVGSSPKTVHFLQSHLIWGIEHKAPAPEPVKLMGFTGQAPDDFESIGERILTQQTLIAQG